MCLCSADMEMVHGYGVRTGTQSTNVKGYRDLFHHRNNNARCHAPHAHYSHLILILAYGEIVSIPFTDHCEYSSKGQEWIVCAVLRTCLTLKHCCMHSGAMLVVM